MNNQERLSELLTMHDEFWQVPYIGRIVNEKYFDMFDHNGYYPSDNIDEYPQYFNNDIILNISCELDSMNRITKINYYKAKDTGVFSRASKFYSLNNADIKAIKIVLDECTCDRTSEILAYVIDKNANNNKEDSSWKVKNVTAKSIAFVSDASKLSVPIPFIKEIIDIGFNYPDVFFSREFWNINEKHLTVKYKDPLLFLFSSATDEKYSCFSRSNTALEILEREKDINYQYKKLLSDVSSGKNNLDYDFLNCDCRDEYIIDRCKSEEGSLLQCAVDCKRESLIPIFVENFPGFVKDKLEFNGQEINVLVYLAQKDLYDVFIKTIPYLCKEDKIVNEIFNGADLKYIKILVENGFVLNLGKNYIADKEKIVGLVGYDNVFWNVEALSLILDNHLENEICRIFEKRQVYSDKATYYLKFALDSGKTSIVNAFLKSQLTITDFINYHLLPDVIEKIVEIEEPLLQSQLLKLIENHICYQGKLLMIKYISHMEYSKINNLLEVCGNVVSSHNIISAAEGRNANWELYPDAEKIFKLITKYEAIDLYEKKKEGLPKLYYDMLSATVGIKPFSYFFKTYEPLKKCNAMKAKIAKCASERAVFNNEKMEVLKDEGYFEE